MPSGTTLSSEPALRPAVMEKRRRLLHRIALCAIAAPRRIVAIAALVMVGAAIFGVPVAGSLAAGGFQDPGSESARATRVLTETFGRGDMQLVFAVTDPVKPTTKEAVASLKALGIEVAMITGDNRRTAEAVAEKLSDVPERNQRLGHVVTRQAPTRRSTKRSRAVIAVPSAISTITTAKYLSI